MVRTSVRVPKRQRMAWAVALAAGFVASTAVLTSHPAPPSVGDVALGGPAAVALPAGFRAPTLGAAPQAGPGITVLATPIKGNQGLTVSETIRVASPIASITLSPPTLPKGFGAKGVSIADVVVVANGTAITLDFTSLKSQQVVALPPGTSTVTVSYVLSGVQQSGSPSVLALKPITSVGDGVILPVSFVVAAKASLACPNLPTSAQAACSAGDPGTAAVSMLSGLASTQSTLLIDLAPGGPTSTTTDTPVTAGGQPTGSGGPVTATADGGTGPTTTAAPGAGSTISTPPPDASSPTTGTSSTTPPATTVPTSDAPTTDVPTTTTPPTPDPTSTATPTSPVAPDPTSTTPVPDPGVTLPTGTPTNGSDGSTATTTTPAPAASDPGTQNGSASSASSASSAVAPTAQQTTPATGSTGGTGDAAPVVAPDPSAGGPSTESVGAADDAVPAAGDATTPAPATSAASTAS